MVTLTEFETENGVTILFFFLNYHLKVEKGFIKIGSFRDCQSICNSIVTLNAEISKAYFVFTIWDLNVFLDNNL